MNVACVKYTSFATLLGQFEFFKMSFGLATSPLLFSRFVQIVFDEFIRGKKI